MIKWALKILKGYCSKHTSCEHCLLKYDDTDCWLQLNIVPQDYDVELMVKGGGIDG